MQLGSRWERKNQHLILRDEAGEGNMGKGDKRGIAQRGDGECIISTFLDLDELTERYTPSVRDQVPFRRA